MSKHPSNPRQNGPLRAVIRRRATGAAWTGKMSSGSHNHQEDIRGFNLTTAAHRREVIVLLTAIRKVEGEAHGRWDWYIAPGIVDYCTGVLAPYVAAYRRSQRTWEGLRAFEEEEEVYRRRPYVAGRGRDELKTRLAYDWRAA